MVGEEGREEEKSPMIILPKDEELVGKLKRKLEEYKERLEDSEKKAGSLKFKSPEQIFSIDLDSKYKILVLEELLKSGSVDTYSLSRQINQKYGFLHVNEFGNACGVIYDYCTDGESIGGTGLK